jgi:transforming growth factor-beta-induced protein
MSTPRILAAGALLSCFLSIPACAQARALDLTDGPSAWQTVVDGVMGGRSSGRLREAEAGVVTFSGTLSLENNGGFSQMRRSARGRDFDGASGIEIECRGDGREYNFDVRVSNARMMAGGFQQSFATKDGDWVKVRLPFDKFELYSFGRKVRRAPELDPAKIESIGVTLSDKKAGPFQLDVRSIRAYDTEEVALAAKGTSDGSDLVSVARRAGLNTLLTCVTTAGLELPEGPVTIFAPTDDAFGALPKETVDLLLSPAGREQLTSILTYHVVAGRNGSAAVLNARELQSLNGQPLAIDASKAQIAGASILAVDVPFDGGVVHVIDKVMLPEQRAIKELAAASEQLSTLVAAATAGGLVNQLDGDNGPWTVFAPVDSAFAKLPAGTVESLLERGNRGKLVDILSLHVVPGRIAARELLAKGTLTSLRGRPVMPSLQAGGVTVNGAKIVAADIQAANGVIHLIDTVLLPASEEAPATDELTARASMRSTMSNGDLFDRVDAIYKRAVAFGVPRFNDGDPGACADIYEVACESILQLVGDLLPSEAKQNLKDALSNASQVSTDRSRAWALRRGLDAAWFALEQAPKSGALSPRGDER